MSEQVVCGMCEKNSLYVMCVVGEDRDVECEQVLCGGVWTRCVCCV